MLASLLCLNVMRQSRRRENLPAGRPRSPLSPQLAMAVLEGRHDHRSSNAEPSKLSVCRGADHHRSRLPSDVRRWWRGSAPAGAACPPADLDLLWVENVGNLVLSGDLRWASTSKVALLSVTGGDDKPLKYPGDVPRGRMRA